MKIYQSTINSMNLHQIQIIRFIILHPSDEYSKGNSSGLADPLNNVPIILMNYAHYQRQGLWKTSSGKFLAVDPSKRKIDELMRSMNLIHPHTLTAPNQIKLPFHNSSRWSSNPIWEWTCFILETTCWTLNSKEVSSRAYRFFDGFLQIKSIQILLIDYIFENTPLWTSFEYISRRQRDV